MGYVRLGQGPWGEGRGSHQADCLTSVGQEVPDYGFKIPVLGAAQTTRRLIRFGLVPWLSKSDSILATALFLFFSFPFLTGTSFIWSRSERGISWLIDIMN